MPRVATSARRGRLKNGENDMLVSTTLLERSAGASAYWHRVGQLARQSLGATSSIVAELQPGTHHLVVRVLDGVDLGGIKERRLDIRRSPYRKAHTTLGPAWHDEYLTAGRTLLVPLLVEETSSSVSDGSFERAAMSRRAWRDRGARQTRRALDTARDDEPNPSRLRATGRETTRPRDPRRGTPVGCCRALGARSV